MNDDIFDYHSIPPGYYDEIFQRRSGIQSQWHHVKFRGVRQKMLAVGGDSVLDIGCGPGTFAAVLPDFNYTGVDMADEQIAYAKQQYGDEHHNFSVSRAGELDFPDHRFDLATSVEVIEHITKDEGHAMLSGALRCLKPGGHLVITTPNYRSHWPLLERIVSRVSAMDYVDQHITHYTKPKLQRLLHEVGFTDIRVRSFVHTAPFLAALSWKLSDWVFAVEYRVFRTLGATLLATAQKPQA